MRRSSLRLTAAGATLTLAAGLLLPGSGVAASTPSAGRAALSGLVCRTALDPAQRQVSVTSVMRPVSGTAKMAVNFHLQERTAGTAPFKAVKGPELGTWISKAFGQRPGDVWRVIHPVSDLAAPATYRFSVGFRWFGAAGQILAHTTLLSRACHQPELRPNLQVLAIGVTGDPTNPQEQDYNVRIRNAGATGAGPFVVQLSNQGQLIYHTVRRLRAHTARSVLLVGPMCSTVSPPTVTVDPDHQVDVYTRARASLTASCPAP